VASDFDKLFGDDWRPQDAGSDDAGVSRGRDGEPSDRNLFDSLDARSADGFYTSENENRFPRSLNEKEVKVDNVYLQQHDGGGQHFVLLRDNRARRVKIYVGQFEALAISLAMEGEDPVRPFTHDLTKLIIDKLEATIERVVIDDLWNEVFYAKITLQKSNGTTVEIDARPSDAIALAIRMKAPIYMAEVVLEQAVHSE
jgi:hypothetical protein